MSIESQEKVFFLFDFSNQSVNQSVNNKCRWSYHHLPGLISLRIRAQGEIGVESSWVVSALPIPLSVVTCCPSLRIGECSVPNSEKCQDNGGNVRWQKVGFFFSPKKKVFFLNVGEILNFSKPNFLQHLKKRWNFIFQQTQWGRVAYLGKVKVLLGEPFEDFQSFFACNL